MALPRDPNALATLLRLQSPANMTPTTDPFFNKRKQQIVGGDDELAPSELDQMLGQAEIRERTGMGVSRDMVRDSGIQGLKQKLGLIQAESQAKLQPEIIKGEYGVREARESATAAESRRAANESAAEIRQAAREAAAEARLNKTLAAQQSRQDDAQDFKRGSVNPSAVSAIARERQHLADEIRKSEPGAIGKFFRRTNPRQAELETYDAALETAQKIASQFPDASVEEALGALGEDSLTPDEAGQVQKFLLMLRGH